MPSPSVQGLQFLCIFTNTYLALFRRLASPAGVRGHLPVVCISPVMRDIRSLLAYSWTICISLEKFLFVSLASFLSFLFRVLYVIPPVILWGFFIRTRVLYIMCLLILCGGRARNYPVPSRPVGCLCIHDVSLCCQKLLRAKWSLPFLSLLWPVLWKSW